MKPLVLWLLDPHATERSRTRKALLKAFPEAQIREAATASEWEALWREGELPRAVITEADLPWGSVVFVLREVKKHNPLCPVILFTNEIAENALVQAFRNGLDEYLPKAPHHWVLLPRLLEKALDQAEQRRTLLASEARLRLLHRIDRHILSARSPDEIARQALPTLLSLVGCAFAGVGLIDPHHFGGRVLATAVRGPHPPFPFRNPPRQIVERVMQERQTITWSLEEFLPADSAYLRYFKQLGLDTMTTIPLQVGAQIMGVLNLGWRQRSSRPPHALEIAQQVANQLAIAIHTARLLEEERRARRTAESLQRASLALSHTLDPEEVLQTLLDELAKHVPYVSANAWLLEDGVWRPRALRGYQRFGVHEHVANRAVALNEWETFQILQRTLKPLLIEDTRQSPLWHEDPQMTYIRSWMGLPLVAGGKLLGIFCLDHTQPHGFTADHLALAEALAAPAAVALQNAQLFRREQARRQELQALREASLRLTSALDLDTVIKNTVLQVARLTQSEDAHLFLFDGKRLTLGAAYYAGKFQSKPYSRLRPQGVTYTVVRTGEEILIPDARHSPFYRDRPWQGSLVSLPLRYGDEVLGVLNVAWPHPKGYNEDILRVLRMLADHVAVALQNARLVDDLRRRIHELHVMARLSAALRQAPDSQAIAAVLTREAATLLEAQAAILTRFVDNQPAQAVIEGIYNLPSDLVGRFFNTREHGITRTIVETGQPFVTQDITQDPRVQHPHWFAGMGPGVGVALRTVEGQVLGVLVVVRQARGRPFTEAEVSLVQTVAEIGANALQRAHAFEALEQTFLQVVLALARAIDARDAYTGDHSARLAEWALAIADEMGLSEAEKQNLHWAALLHDIGKLGIPDEILLKPGALSPEERESMKQHPLIGAQIVGVVPRLQPVAEIIAAHHERWDGSGYPKGLKGEEIPLGARILAVVDSYGAMVDERVYRPARSHEEAVEEIRRLRGKLYDPQVVDAFLRVVEQGLVSPQSEEAPILALWHPPPPDPEGGPNR